jgi:hypothetical protein
MAEKNEDDLVRRKAAANRLADMCDSLVPLCAGSPGQPSQVYPKDNFRNAG